MQQIWTGTYEYEGRRLPPRLGKAKVCFEMHVQFIDEIQFKGKILEDEQSGGMKGHGIVEGKVRKRKITFVKQMPFMTVFLSDGTRNTESISHRKIYYTGIKTEDGFEGKWRFRIGFKRIGNKLYFFPGSKGKWKMKFSTHLNSWT